MNLPFLSENVEVPKGALKIQELSRDEVIKRLDDLLKMDIGINGQNTESFIDIPLRRRENIIYNKNGNIFLGEKKEKLFYNDKYKTLNMIIHVARMIKEILTKNLHATKRDIFYNDPRLYKEQKKSDIALDILTSMLQTRRKCLNIVASPRGRCIGRLTIKDREEKINLTKVKTYGWAISPLLEQIELIESDAEFILVLEKDAAFIRLNESKFWEKIPCILISGAGMPGLATKEFLKKLVAQLKIPALGLFDSDPYGLAIGLMYSKGTIASAHETPWLAVNNFYWIGIYPNEIKNIKERCKLGMTEMDLLKSDEILSRPNIKNKLEIVKQLKLMKKNKLKVELQSLCHYEENFIDILLEKIDTQNFIKL